MDSKLKEFIEANQENGHFIKSLQLTADKDFFFIIEERDRLIFEDEDDKSNFTLLKFYGYYDLSNYGFYADTYEEFKNQIKIGIEKLRPYIEHPEVMASLDLDESNIIVQDYRWIHS